MSARPWRVREYREDDEESWVRCRTLAFLATAYYDDVRPRRVALEPGSLSLVAVRPRPDDVRTAGPDQVIGVLDIEPWDDDGVRRATIDTVASHPDLGRSGVAGALLAAALPWLAERAVVSLDAWTREDPAANAWYRRHGFTMRQQYLHVYKSWDDDVPGFAAPAPLSTPVTAFAHARLEHEGEVRDRFARVHRCRQYQRDLPG